MVRPSDEFVLAWRSLSGGEQDSGWRTIAVTSSSCCLLSAGRRFPGNEEALLVGFSTTTVSAAEKLPVGQGFNIERVNPHRDGKTWLALSHKTSGNADLFTTMVCDIAGALDDEPSADEQSLLRLFLGRVRAWQEFMRKGAQALSPEEEIGLIGELSLVQSTIEAGMSAATAIEAWVGPLGGVQDLEIGTGSIEVKTTLSPVGFSARFGSLEQLDDLVRQPLFVAGVRLRQITGGQNLPEFVEKLRAFALVDTEAERLLSERMIAAGYFDAHADRYPRRFEISGIRLVEVGDEFPRLTPGRVPIGILKATYELDLDKIQGANVAMSDALKKLGAL